jgi:hypothetical protein
MLFDQDMGRGLRKQPEQPFPIWSQLQEFWPTEMQPVVTDLVTVYRVAENNTAGWPCTVFRVTQVTSGVAATGHEVWAAGGWEGLSVLASLCPPWHQC